ncbi:MAG: hypothetical protein AB7O60_08245 [Variibacter sp.]
MNLFDFFTQDELDDAPEDEALAFTHLVNIAQRKLADRVKQLDLTNENGWEEQQEARHGFMNVVIGLAKTYKVEPFASIDVPRPKDFTAHDYREFKSDLDHYMTQLVVGNSIRSRRESVELSLEAKQKIRNYLTHIRAQIDECVGLDEGRKAALLKALADFEAALEKRRLNLMAITALWITLIGAPGALAASYTLIAEMTHRVVREVAEAKAVEDQNRRLPPTEPRLAITPPRQIEVPPSPKPRESMDDEIPF